MAPNLPEEYVRFWIAQRNLFAGLTLGLIGSNLLIAVGLFLNYFKK